MLNFRSLTGGVVNWSSKCGTERLFGTDGYEPRGTGGIPGRR